VNSLKITLILTLSLWIKGDKRGLGGFLSGGEYDFLF